MIHKGETRQRERQFSDYVGRLESFSGLRQKSDTPFFDTPLPIKDANLKAIQALVEKGPHFVANFRVEQLKNTWLLPGILSPKNDCLRSLCILMSGRSCSQSLFGKMLKDAGVQDERLLQVDGFRLVGQQPPSGQFPVSVIPAAIDVESLKESAKWSKHMVQASCRRQTNELQRVASRPFGVGPAGRGV